MLEQPDQLAARPSAIAAARASMAASAVLVGDGPGAARHSTGRNGGRPQPDRHIVARVNHLVTIPW